jgi:flagellar biosynthetic protein FliQ
MAPLAELTGLGENALLIAIAVSLPALLVAAVVGLLISGLQAVTQLQDATLSHLPRLLAVALTLVIVGPWMGSQIATFALQAFALR